MENTTATAPLTSRRVITTIDLPSLRIFSRNSLPMLKAICQCNFTDYSEGIHICGADDLKNDIPKKQPLLSNQKHWAV